MTPDSKKTDLKVGDVLEVEIGPIAHGGHFIAHAHGRTIFVRHSLPGERVRVQITEVLSKIIRADAIEILQASIHRVDPPCALASPGGCGGCDFQHVEMSYQRELKEQVIKESLQRHGRLAEIEINELEVRPVPGDSDGLSWRTRVQWGVDGQGSFGFHRVRSEEIQPVAICPIAVPELASPPEISAQVKATGVRSVKTGSGFGGEVCIALEDEVIRGSRRLVHAVRDRLWRVDIDSFWQVHPGAPEALVEAVLSAGKPRPGEVWWDLYSGVGLFSAYLAGAVGPSGHIDAVEGAPSAIRDARRNLHEDPNVVLHHDDVTSWVAGGTTTPHGVVLNPPRAGAGDRVVRAIASRRPRVVVYVACDPVALARDVATFAGAGYRWEGGRAFDTFPMTHHVEVVATLVPFALPDRIS